MFLRVFILVASIIRFFIRVVRSNRGSDERVMGMKAGERGDLCGVSDKGRGDESLLAGGDLRFLLVLSCLSSLSTGSVSV